MLKQTDQASSEMDPETSVSLISSINKNVSIDEDKSKCLTCKSFGVKLVIVLTTILTLILVSIMVLCFADATRHLRCALADSLDVTLKQCGVTGTLNSLNREPAMSQKSIYDSGIVNTHLKNYTSVVELNESRQVPLDELHDDINFSIEQKAYIELAESSWEIAWEILDDENGWTLEDGESLSTGMVYSKSYENFGSVFKLRGYVDVSPAEILRLFVIEGKSSEWSSIIDTSYIIENVTNDVRVVYSTTVALAKGLITPRDYVSLSHWKSRNGVVLHSVTATTHPDYPENDEYIRAKNRPGGFLFRPVKNEPNKCQLEWSVSIDLGGWLPDWMVDNGKAKSMLAFFSNICDAVEKPTERQ